MRRNGKRVGEVRKNKSLTHLSATTDHSQFLCLLSAPENIHARDEWPAEQSQMSEIPKGFMAKITYALLFPFHPASRVSLMLVSAAAINSTSWLFKSVAIWIKTMSEQSYDFFNKQYLREEKKTNIHVIQFLYSLHISSLRTTSIVVRRVKLKILQLALS